ncbi:hypothetical protein G7046_g7028 [Stylonectria norvegica]|nr:hypothetical protein G7046_g7028 [Stylonectria norvegica]
MSETIETSVIVVGGSLVGLSTALFLSELNVPVTLLERHPSSSLHPRAIGYTARTLEILRSIGADSRLPKAQWTGGPPRRIVVESLTGKWQDEKAWTPKPSGPGKGKAGDVQKTIEDYSPATGIATAQDKIEPVLRECAVERGADLRLGCKLTSWAQDSEGVTATAVDQSGNVFSVKGKYLVACDGGRSPIREALGIEREGGGHFKVLRSILFRCPEINHYLEKGYSQFQIEGRDDGFEGFLTTYLDGRWALMWNPTGEQAELATMDEATQKAMIRKAVGKEIADADIELITTGEWDLSGLVATKFSSGRVFIAGDAAHSLPPNRGGYGANTGISDAHNIAWKLAAVLSGVSRPELLETYDVERRSVARVRHDQIFARDDHKRFVGDRVWPGKSDEIFDEIAMEFGQLYKSGGFIGVDEGLPLAKRPDEWNGQPGTRAPHIPFLKGGETISSLDLLYHGWVLLSKDSEWKSALAEASIATGVASTFVQIGVDVEETETASFEKSFGVKDGAVLVRPDGYIAWRSAVKTKDALGSLKKALEQVSYSSKATA